jgi:diguanylate cyclase (GGDEF)-like protein/PAS domain S-box-containing protein
MENLEEMNKMIVEHTPDLFLLVDADGKILLASPSCSHFIGMKPDALAARPYFFGLLEDDLPLMQKAWSTMLQFSQPCTIEYRYKLADGEALWVECKMNPVIKDKELQFAVLAARDISERKRLEEELINMAYYDSLTGLPNRRLFQDRFTQALLSAKRYGHNLAVMYLDLDDFKSVNDTYGHGVGDQLLKIASARLVNCIRDPDTICRVGGDEFLVLLQQFEASDDLEKIASRMIESLNQLISIQDHDITITCSIGAAIMSNDIDNGDALIQLADMAMYTSKNKGKNQFTLYKNN